MSPSNSIIAGRQGGKKVYVVPAVKPAFDLLNLKAKAGNHWARIAVAGLTNLSSGRIGKDNIFVRPNLADRQGRTQRSLRSGLTVKGSVIWRDL